MSSRAVLPSDFSFYHPFHLPDGHQAAAAREKDAERQQVHERVLPANRDRRPQMVTCVGIF